jgi:putative glutamine amidotransferase
MNMIRRSGLFLLAVFLLQGCQSPTPHETQTETFVEGRKHILLMHPTVNNLRTFYFLTTQGLFTLPEDYRVVGVYHHEGRYDYSLSEAYILEEGLENIALLGLEPALGQDELFGENALSPAFAELFSNSKGVIFFGGPDIPPAVYMEETDLLTVITDPHRHHLELSFLFHLLGGHQDASHSPLLESDPHYRILGICLGMQSMNVATGGTLIQDIPTAVYGKTTVEQVLAMEPDMQHRNYQTHYSLDQQITSYSYHRIRMEPGTGHAALVAGPESFPVVMSSHHQAADKLGKGFRVTAWSMDGKVVEAIEHETYPHVVGVQYHPELRFIYEPDTKVGHVPGKEAEHAYMDLWPGEKGADFHRDFWSYIGVMYP